jgi:lantibiotic modifying enzyme
MPPLARASSLGFWLKKERVGSDQLAQVSTALSHGAIALLLTLLAASGVHPQYVLLPL